MPASCGSGFHQVKLNGGLNLPIVWFTYSISVEMNPIFGHFGGFRSLPSNPSLRTQFCWITLHTNDVASNKIESHLKSSNMPSKDHHIPYFTKRPHGQPLKQGTSRFARVSGLGVGSNLSPVRAFGFEDEIPARKTFALVRLDLARSTTCPRRILKTRPGFPGCLIDL